MNTLAANLRKLRLDKHLTQEQAASALGVSPQAVSRWETSTTLPDVLLLPDIARLYGVLVDDLFKPNAPGYANNALRLLAVFERTHKPEDFLAAQQEFDRLIRSGLATADDFRSCGVAHEYMVYECLQRANACFDRAAAMARDTDSDMLHRVIRQQTLLRCRTGQGAACVAEQEAALHEHPDDPQHHVDLAHACFFAGRHEEALRVCTDALERFPKEGLLHVYAGDACRALRRYAEAFPHWEAALRLDDKFLDAMFSMAFCREELGEYAAAADLWDDIVSKLDARGLEIEAQWPREMAEKCRMRSSAGA